MFRIKDFFRRIKQFICHKISALIPQYIPKLEVWETSFYMAKDIFRRLEAFKKSERHGYPDFYNNIEEYNKDLEKILDGFKLYFYHEEDAYKEYIENKFGNPHERKPENRIIGYDIPHNDGEAPFPKYYSWESVSSVDEIPKEHIPHILKGSPYKTIEEWAKHHEFYYDVNLENEHWKIIREVPVLLSKIFFHLWD